MEKANCPKCRAEITPNVIGEVPEMTFDKLREHEEYMKRTGMVYGPWDKRYYCKNCNLFF